MLPGETLISNRLISPRVTRFEVLADRIEHAPLDEGLVGFEHVPEVADEVQQPARWTADRAHACG